MCNDHTVTLFFSFSELVLNIGIIPETIQYRTDKLYISDIFAIGEDVENLVSHHIVMFI
jgi:hypothetical protein